MSPGYSGTPLPQKLGIKDGMAVRLVNAPDGFGLPGVTPRGTDVIVLFTTSYADLAKRVPTLGKAIHPNGSLWVAWPKKSSGVPTDVTENDIRDVALPLGLVDNKVCAVTDVWSGLRLVWRKENR